MISLLRLERFQFAVAEFRRFQPLQLRLVEIALGGHPLQLFRRIGPFAAQGEEARMGGADPVAERGVAGVMVQDIELEGTVRQEPRLVLGMDIDKAGGKGLERPHLDGLVVHEGTGAAAPGDRAADNQVAAVRVQVVLLGDGPERLVLLHVEFRLDHAGIPAGTDRPGVSPGAEDEGKGAQQDGLAGAGLPGYNDETLRKTDLQRVYQDVIRDEEFREHRAYLPALR